VISGVRVRLFLEVLNFSQRAHCAYPIGFQHRGPEMLTGSLVLEINAVAPDFQSLLERGDVDIVHTAAAYLTDQVLGIGARDSDSALDIKVFAFGAHGS